MTCTLGSGKSVAELIVSLIVISGLLPGLILLFPGYSIAFYVGTWLVPAIVASKVVAEGKIADTLTRNEAKSLFSKFSFIKIAAKCGVYVIGVGLGLGWLGRNLLFRIMKKNGHGDSFQIRKSPYLSRPSQG